jgi:hypothetical protein
VNHNPEEGLPRVFHFTVPEMGIGGQCYDHNFCRF